VLLSGSVPARRAPAGPGTRHVPGNPGPNRRSAGYFPTRPKGRAGKLKRGRVVCGGVVMRARGWVRVAAVPGLALRCLGCGAWGWCCSRGAGRAVRMRRHCPWRRPGECAYSPPGFPVNMGIHLHGHGDHDGRSVHGGAAGNGVTEFMQRRPWSRPLRHSAGPGGAPDPSGRACYHETEGQVRSVGSQAPKDPQRRR
jgi:hypothetical protein